MADEKRDVAGDVHTTPGTDNTYPTDSPSYRPAGWMYKGVKVGRSEFWYASPKMQLLMVSLVCFMCPGMFNALGGLGGGGQVDPTAQDHANTALYSTFAVVGFFAGTFANRLGLRLTLSVGGLGYCIYAASFLCYSHTENIGFVIFAGALLGVCAGLLWTAQGAIMMSYPPEGSKGRYISWFWMIFNTGAVIGSLVSIPSALRVELRLLTGSELDPSGPEHQQKVGSCYRWHLCCLHHSHVHWCYSRPLPLRRRQGNS